MTILRILRVISIWSSRSRPMDDSRRAEVLSLKWIWLLRCLSGLHLCGVGNRHLGRHVTESVSSVYEGHGRQVLENADIAGNDDAAAAAFDEADRIQDLYGSTPTLQREIGRALLDHRAGRTAEARTRLIETERKMSREFASEDDSPWKEEIDAIRSSG